MKFTFSTRKTQEEILRGIGPFRQTWQYRLATWGVIGQAIISAGALVWYWRRLPPAVPVWYSMPWGSDRLAPPWFLLLPVAASAVIYVANSVLVARTANAYPMFVRILFMTSFLVSVLGTIFVLRVITLVI